MPSKQAITLANDEAISVVLIKLEAAVNNKLSNQDLAKLFSSIAINTPIIEFTNLRYIYLFTGSISVLIFSLFNLTYLGYIAVLFILLSLLSAIFSISLIVIRHLRITSLNQKLQQLYQINLMGLQAEIFDSSAKAEELASLYYEFQRGNYSREVTSLHCGVSKGKTSELDYQLIQFHWVDKRIVTKHYQDEKGNWKQRKETVYDNFYRTSILVQIEFGIEVYIYNYEGTYRGVQWKSTSTRFNDIYKVYGETEITIAKLLKPAVVLLLEKLAEDFKGLNLEFSLDNTLLISMRQTDLLDSSVKLSIKQPAVTAELLLEKAFQPQITKLLSVVDEIGRFSISELRRN